MDDEEFTYAALRRIERQENTSPRLSKLTGRFWERMGEHLTRIRQAFQDQQEDDPTSHRTVVLADELRNTQRLAESIWSLREKKVVHAALAATRKREGASPPLENATAEEQAFFQGVRRVLQGARDEAAITDPFSKRRVGPLASTAAETPQPRASSGSGPVVRPEAPGGQTGPSIARPVVLGAAPATAPAAPRPEPVAAVSSLVPGAPPPDAGLGSEGSSDRPERFVEDRQAPAQEEAQADEGRGGVGAAGEHEVELRLVQALNDVPRFAGPDLTHYELASGEIGNLPARAAELLERRGVVRVLPGA